MRKQNMLRLSAVVAATIVAALLLVTVNPKKSDAATSAIDRWKLVDNVTGTYTAKREIQEFSPSASHTLSESLSIPAVSLQKTTLPFTGYDWMGGGMATATINEEIKTYDLQGQLITHIRKQGTATKVVNGTWLVIDEATGSSGPWFFYRVESGLFSAPDAVTVENVLTGETHKEPLELMFRGSARELPAQGLTLTGSANLYGTDTITWNLTGVPAGNVAISKLNLKDPKWSGAKKIVGFEPLVALSTDNYPYHNGNTRIFGNITVNGPAKDTLESVTLNVTGPGGVVVKARLSDAARQALRQQFGSDREVSFTSNLSNKKPLFLLSSKDANLLDSNQNGKVQLQAIATTRQGRQSPPKAAAPSSVPRLVRYTGKNRYGCCNAEQGGDTWVLPSVRKAASNLDDYYGGTLWGDFSNMNGGNIPPHKTHRAGYDIDGDNVAYDNRTAGVAWDLLSVLRMSPHGTDVKEMYVTFNAPGQKPAKCEPKGGKPPQQDTNHSDFWRAIQNKQIPARGGGTRAATDVILPKPQHCRHFHIRFFPN